MQGRECWASVFKRNLKTEAQISLAGQSATEVAQCLHAFDTVHHFSIYLLTFKNT